MPQPTDVLARLRARDDHAMHELVREHARRVHRAARGMGLSSAEAEEATQDVFVTFLQTLDRFDGRSSIGTWLFGILRHKVQERRRTVVRHAAESIDTLFEQQFDAAGSWVTPPVAVDRLVESSQAAVALRACLGELSDQQRDVFHLRQVEGLSAVEVAEVVGCTANHVGVLFHRARMRLRACLEAKGWGRSR